MNPTYLTLCIIFSYGILVVHSWTDEDLELFDLVESTDRKFYDILGVDQKASASDIRKAYRKLSQIYHPDRNKAPDAEETFRKIAAVAEILKNEEQRKKYDIILQTGLPDWREPVYYYRRVRNMGLFELVIFLFCLATIGQYLFLWSAYLEKKYEMDELMSAKLKKKAKLQKKGKAAKTIAAEELEFSCDIVLPKPKWQDLFPVRLICFLGNLTISLPSYAMFSLEYIKAFLQKSEEEPIDDESENESEIRSKPKKSTQHQIPQYPELSDLIYDTSKSNGSLTNGVANGKIQENGTKHEDLSHVTETDMGELKKAMKKFPHGTLQRWEKIAMILNCSVPKVVSMAKQMKSQEFAKNKLMLLELQGISGVLKDDEKNNQANIQDPYDFNEITLTMKNRFKSVPNGNGMALNHSTSPENCNGTSLEKIWKQEEQRALELALQKFPKETPARWDRIADSVPSKTKEECIARYKELAQQIKKKKVKDN